MKRISIYILFAFSAWTAVAVFDHYFSKQDWSNFYRKNFAHQVDLLTSEGLVAQSFWRARGNYDEFREFLESRRRLDSISFWAIIGPAGVSQGGLKDRSADQIGFDLTHPHDSISRSGNVYYETEDLGGGQNLVLGLIYDEAEFFRHQTEMVWVSLVQYLVGVSVIVFAIFVFFFRDILRSIQQLSKHGVKSFQRGGIHSREADVLIRGLTAYDKNQRELESQAEVLEAQILPSLRTELRSGRTPPYEFTCTLVRSDINNFSKIYNNFPVEPFAQVINEFFTEVSHVVSRYKGLIHEFIGDEVIFYFKDEEVENSAAMAISAIRDMNAVAARIHARTLKERGYPFTIKSTLAQGTIRYGKFVNGYALAGPSLIETVRILSHVTEKDGNVVVYDERHREALDLVASSEEFGQVKLKGFSDERRLLIYRQHHDLEKLLTSRDPQRFSALQCFRSDDDIGQVLSWARRPENQPLAADILKTVGVLRDIPVTSSNGSPQKILLQWIEALILEIRGSGSSSDSRLRLLASILRLTENLLTREEFSEGFERALHAALEIKDRRVVANAIEALTRFRLNYEPEVSARLSRHPDNRVAANALVHEGVRQISPFVIKRLQKMLGSRNVANMASALYALGEISAFHQTQDPVYYKTQIEFLKLVEWIPALATHDDSMVRRQALIAARKCGDDDVIETIYRVAEERGSAGRFTEVQTHLGARRVRAKAG